MSNQVDFARAIGGPKIDGEDKEIHVDLAIESTLARALSQQIAGEAPRHLVACRSDVSPTSECLLDVQFLMSFCVFDDEPHTWWGGDGPSILREPMSRI